ncbi:hypothetical protein ACF0H5_016633 [Mactra antiquata]
MKLSHIVSTIACWFVTASAQNAEFSLLQPQGLKFSLPDQPGISVVGLHYNINQPMNGLEHGQVGVDINTKTGNAWVHENPKVAVKPGDTVNYWYISIQNGIGNLVQDQTWTPSGNTVTPTGRPTTTNTPTGRTTIESTTSGNTPTGRTTIESTTSGNTPTGSTPTGSPDTVLPRDCVPLENGVLDQFDPMSVFQPNSEIGTKQPPVKVRPDIRPNRPLPTQAFFTSQLKSTGAGPMVLWPYFASMDNEGITYDAFEFRRFMDPERTILADQQSMSEDGKPWNRLFDLGTNFFQKVSGPDGNPLSGFYGKSGVKVGIEGSAEPELGDFGDLYGNFKFTGSTGTLEVPLVRGSILLTHIFDNANPVITPFCLDNINGGDSQNFYCPLNPAATNGGSGYLSGECTGSTLTITLHNTRPITDISLIQWAANTASQYGSSHAMHNCDESHCRLLENGQRLDITVPNAHGTMYFAINYIANYVIPGDWINKPQEVTCTTSGKRESSGMESDLAEGRVGNQAIRREKRGVTDIGLNATCDASNTIKIALNLADYSNIKSEKIQYAVEHANNWGNPPPMRNCGSMCTISGNVVTIRKQMNSNHLKFAINVIGHIVLPFQNWISQPLEITCGIGQVVRYGSSGLEIDNENVGTTTTKKTTSTTTQAVTSQPPETQGTTSHQPITQQPTTTGAGRRGSHENDTVFDEHFGVYSSTPKTSFCASESTGKAYLTFKWNPNYQDAQSATSRLLMLTMPHHVNSMTTKYLSNLKNTVFGFKAMTGSELLLEMKLPRASMEPDPTAVATLTQQQRQEIIAAIDRDAQTNNLDWFCSRADSYGVGKAISFVARLASISRTFNTQHYTVLDESVRNCLEKWLRIQDVLDDMWKFKYDTVWGGLFLKATRGEVQFGAGFGFPFYNDHHFHLGYFIYAAGYYVKHYPDWGSEHRHKLYLWARDVANPTHTDPYFPVVRHMDMYTGFSWASGIVPGSRQEESASESLNCYHGVAALGEAFNDKKLQHVGQTMLAMELTSVREYWQVRAHNRDHFPPLIQDTGVCGQITEDSFYVYTLNWPCEPNVFPMRHACLVGIQVIPITAVSKYWVDQEWAASIKHSCESAVHFNRESEYSIADKQQRDRKLAAGWAAFCLAALSPLDASHKTEAANFLQDKNARDLVGGTGAASTLLFIYAST